MLFILIPVVWLAVTVVCVAVCRMAAQADAMPTRETDTRPVPKYRLSFPEPGSERAIVRDLRRSRGPRLTGHGV